jgi:glycosyltransferase involved in cell wall biosynthesis
MRFLVLSFYYAPDLSAGSFRTTNLVGALGALPGGDVEMEVLTTLPNRYHSFRVAIPEEERTERLLVRRFPLPEHKGGFASQSRAFAAYAASVLRFIRGRHYDAVFATSSRLMTAVLGSRIARARRLPLYLDIRDIFVDTIGDVLPRRTAAIAKPLFKPLERYAISRAETINLVSRGFADYFRSRYPTRRYKFFTNGIDPEFVAAAPRIPGPPTRDGRPVHIVYAGNMGDGQGLHAIIPALANGMRESATFTLIGDGGRRADLERGLTAAGCTNVTLAPPMARGDLLRAYADADVLFLHLNDYEAFAKVLPSKIFEYAALGKPIWAGVRGYAAAFLREEVSNCAVFHPCDAADAQQVFGPLDLRTIPRTGFVERFARDTISRKMAEDIVAVCGQR